MRKKKIAIVGSGVSGLGALYAFKDTNHEVHLFEAEDKLGGHTNTVDFDHIGHKIPVDTGFIVMNTATYPNFIAFLRELRIKTKPTEMTFGISRDYGVFEWSGTSLNGIFAQRENLFRPRFLRMIFDIIRFNQFALDLLHDETVYSSALSIGEYLDQEGYSEGFRDDYLIPMTACVWSTGADKCALEFPAVTLVRFLWNHHLLSTLSERPPWLTIPGGSKQYIDGVLKSFPRAQVHLSKPVRSVLNDPDGKVILVFDGAENVTFDYVILACHGNQAMDIISTTASKEEQDIMGAFHTTPNTAYMHSDLSLMPERRSTWSSWNYLTVSKPASYTSTKLNHMSGKASSKETSDFLSPSGALQKVALTYNMNILQHFPLPSAKHPNHHHPHILVTLNPPHPPASHLTQAVIPYAHPLYNAAAIRAQNQLEDIQGTRGIYYCGAWTGYGFHEDGFRSGIEVATRIELGGVVGWQIVDAREMRGSRPALLWRDHLARVFILVILIMGRSLGLFVGLISSILEGGRRKIPKKVDVKVDFKMNRV